MTRAATVVRHLARELPVGIAFAALGAGGYALAGAPGGCCAMVGALLGGPPGGLLGIGIAALIWG